MKPKHILVVEDDKQIVESLRDLLEICDYKVDIALNGLNGLSKARSIKPDAVILDIMMPVMDGIEFLTELRKDDSLSHTPVIVLTAKHTFDDKIEGYESGADHYLTKPFEHKELLLVLENLLSRRELMTKKILSSPDQVFATSKDEKFLAELRGFIMDNIQDENLDLDIIADNLSYSRSSVQKKVKAITGKSISQFVREFRLEFAMQLIKSNAANVKEIAFQSGFHSHAYFSKCFREVYGKTPKEVIQEHN